MIKVLLVEDDPKVADHIKNGFHAEGHDCICVIDGAQGLAAGRDNTVDVIVLDVMLPKIDGLTVLEQLRAHSISTPVLLLSAKSQVEDKVKGLRKGANDYLTKPFAFEELLARVEGLATRESDGHDSTHITLGDLTLDLVNRKVLGGDHTIDLQSKEFQLLECLLRNRGKVVTRSMLLEQVWNYHFDPQTNVIDVHISRLRQKLESAFNRPLIQTVRGTGYRFKDMMS